MNTDSPESRGRWGWSWVALALSLVLHVVDEATHDFLSWYNPLVQSIRSTIGWIPFPVFRFDVWLAGLIAGIMLMLLLAPFAFRNVRFLRRLAFPLSILMVFNALGHVAASLYYGRFMPGVYSAPVLLVASICLLVNVVRVSRNRQSEAAIS